MDPLSIATSVAALISAASAVGDAVAEMMGSNIFAPWGLHKASAELTDLLAVLPSLLRLFEDQENIPGPSALNHVMEFITAQTSMTERISKRVRDSQNKRTNSGSLTLMV